MRFAFNEIKKPGHVLPALMAFVTQRPRYFPEIQWAERSWTHNIFRAYEYVFGRRFGIRPELSAAVDRDGHVTYACHSWESVFALTEHLIREALAWRWKPVRLFIPVLITPQGIPVFASPYIFAVALDTAADNVLSTSVSTTWAHTMTGSNVFAAIETLQAVEAADDITGFAYNSVACTKILAQRLPNNDRFQGLWGIAGPTTGTNNFAISFSGNFMEATSVSYSGCNQSGQPVDTTSGSTGLSASFTQSITTTVDNSWVIAVIGNNARNISASTGATVRTTRAESTRFFDSNGPVHPAGSYSMSATATDAAGSWGYIMASIQPVAAAAASRNLALLGVG